MSEESIAGLAPIQNWVFEPMRICDGTRDGFARSLRWPKGLIDRRFKFMAYRDLRASSSGYAKCKLIVTGPNHVPVLGVLGYDRLGWHLADLPQDVNLGTKLLHDSMRYVINRRLQSRRAQGKRTCYLTGNVAYEQQLAVSEGVA